MEDLQVDIIDGKFYIYLTLIEKIENVELVDGGFGIKVNLKNRKFKIKLPHPCKEIEKVEKVSSLMYLIIAKPRYPELLPSEPFTYEEDEDDLPDLFGPSIEKVEDRKADDGLVLLIKKDEEDEVLEKWLKEIEEEIEDEFKEEESKELEEVLFEEEEEDEEGYEFYDKPFKDDEDEWDQGVIEDE